MKKRFRVCWYQSAYNITAMNTSRRRIATSCRRCASFREERVILETLNSGNHDFTSSAMTPILITVKRLKCCRERERENSKFSSSLHIIHAEDFI